MIYLDANIFLRHLTAAPDSHTENLQSIAEDLFLMIEDGSVEATTSEIAIHQTLYFLTHRHFYNYPANQAVESVRALLSLKGFRFQSGDRSIIFRALDLYESLPTLGFADSVIAARCEVNGWELATFDQRLGSLPNVTRWQPA